MRRTLVLLTLLASVVGATFGLAPARAAFPGANGKIAFETGRDGNVEIYAMNQDGSAQTNLTNNPATDTFPAWSANGLKIAFVSVRDGFYDIYTMNANGTGATRLTNTPDPDFMPTWSPDGSKIAYICFSGNNSDICVMNYDGTSPTQVTSSPLSASFPVWSPDGTKIAFENDTSGPTIDLINPDGTGHTSLATGVVPDWSPDGSKIAFSRGGDIYVMNADGSGQSPLKTNERFSCCAAWSPDGLRLAFEKDDPYPNRDIFVIGADGTGQSRLTTVSYNSHADWQPLVPRPPSLGGVAAYPPGGHRGPAMVALVAALLATGVLVFSGAAYVTRR